MTHTILVVEDDHVLREILGRGLREKGFVVRSAADAATAIDTMGAQRIDAIVLDITLPDGDGRDVCIALRARGIDVPVIFLTARGNLSDRLTAFAAGADDYMGKPFALAELIVRLQAVLRRRTGPVQEWGDLRLEPNAHSMRCNGAQTALTPIEFRLLAKLLAAPNAVIRRNDLIATAWPSGAMVSDNTLDQYISRLRRKLSDANSLHRIEAARGVGYRIF